MATQRFFLPAQDVLPLVFEASIFDAVVTGRNRLTAFLDTGVEARIDFRLVGPDLFRIERADYRLPDGTRVLLETGFDTLVDGFGNVVEPTVAAFDLVFSDADDRYDVAAWQAVDAIEVDVIGATTADAGGGFDVIVFDGPRNGVAVATAPGGGVRVGFGGDDVLIVNLEQIRFTDCTLEIAADGRFRDCTLGSGLSPDDARTVALLFEAALNRDGAIGLEGLNFWIDKREEGLSERALAQNFLVSPEFRANFGEAVDAGSPDFLADRALVEVLFRNVLDRDGAEPGIDFWTARVAAPEFSRADLLIAFAESAENIAGSPFVETLSEVEPGFWDFA